MDIAIRVPLFYVMDFYVNKITAPNKPIVTQSAVENSISVNDQNSSSEHEANFSSSTIENVSAIVSTISEEIEVSLYNYDYTSHIKYPSILCIIVHLMLMLMSSTPTKRFGRVGICTVITVILFVIGCFIPQISLFKLKVNNEFVLCIRIIIFAIVSCFMYAQMSAIRRTVSTKLAILTFTILSTLNIQDIQFHLAKYFLIFYLIFLIVYQMPFPDFFTQKKYLIKYMIIICAFYAVHLHDYVAWSKYADAVKPTSSPRETWGSFTLQLFHSDCMGVIRASAMLTVIYPLSCIVNVLAVEGVPTDKCSYSPVLFFLFILDKILWEFELENRWSIVLIYIAMYFAGILFNFCEIITHAMRFEDKKRKFLVILSSFTLIGAICVLGVCGWGLMDRVETRIVIYFATYSLIMPVLSGSLLILIEQKRVEEVRWAYYWRYVDDFFKFLVLTFIINDFLQFSLCPPFDLLLFLGFVYFVFKLWEVVRDFCLLIVKRIHIFSNFSKSTKCEELLSNKYCGICHKVLVSEWFVTTACEHQFHKRCIVFALLTDDDKCHHCEFDLMKHIELKYKLDPKEAGFCDRIDGFLLTEINNRRNVVSRGEKFLVKI